VVIVLVSKTLNPLRTASSLGSFSIFEDPDFHRIAVLCSKVPRQLNFRVSKIRATNKAANKTKGEGRGRLTIGTSVGLSCASKSSAPNSSRKQSTTGRTRAGEVNCPQPSIIDVMSIIFRHAQQKQN
jgi:hypothetical protein